MNKRIKKAIVSVYYKEGLEELIRLLDKLGVELYSTGGTFQYIVGLGISCTKIESVTNFPEILGGRVKTLNPNIFAGLLARSENEEDRNTMDKHALPYFDLLICNLYPFEEYIKNNASEEELIEKIDIGGVSLIRAAAKNYREVVCISNPYDYKKLFAILLQSEGNTSIDERRSFASNAFQTVASYDREIANYFQAIRTMELRYGENPHQKGSFIGDFDALFEKLHGKEISYNNILDIDAALNLVSEFTEGTFAILKHNNSCGVASRRTPKEAYLAALESDPVSAFGGVLATNMPIDEACAQELSALFFEIIIAPSYSEEALKILKEKRNRIILRQKSFEKLANKKRTALNGILVQETDVAIESSKDWKVVTKRAPSSAESEDLEFGVKVVKHLKSNGIALIKNKQLIGMGCGQVSRVDALRHAIKKAKEFALTLDGAIMASDAFFPFSDCVEIAHHEGIKAVAQPGGSIKDEESIEYCDQAGMTMVMTGIRHFNH